MRICHKLELNVFILLVTAVLSLSGQGNAVKNLKWERERLAPGLVHLHSHSHAFDTLLQNVNILLVNTRTRQVGLLHDPEINKPVYRHVEGTSALAAVNAGFFNIREGGSVTYIRVDGKIPEADTAGRWKRVQNMNGALLIDGSGKVTIARAMTNDYYDSHPGYEDVLVTGCLLLLDGNVQPMPQTSLVVNRHPRTCIGIRGRNRVVLLTLDGRTDQSAGMTLPALSQLMLRLGCSEAVNLDGGGSTTMWIKGKPFNGIVNMPCDNKKFDHEGARAVANIVAVN